MTTQFPYLISYIIVAMNVSMEGMNFEHSQYNIVQGANKFKSVADDKVRKSQICQMPVPILDEVSQPLINDYLDRHKPGFEYANPNVDWRILRYNQSGHFSQHRDRPRLLEGYFHFATEIYIPPYSQVQFKGGELVMWNKKKIQTIKPHSTKWTHVLMPLGILHKVHKITNGTRISYTKSVYLQTKGAKAQRLAENSTNNAQL